MTSATTSTSSSSTAPLVVNGLISGINTTSVISALLQGYQVPITNLQDQQTSLGSEASDYQTLNSDMQSLLTTAQALDMPSSWNLTTATSSVPTVATATSSPGAQTGSMSFDVEQLAEANLLASSGGVSSTGTVVTSAASLLLATGGQALGFSSFANGGLAVGSHTIEVTQASAAATVTGSSPLPASTAVRTGSNDSVDLSVNGTAYAITLAPGTSESPSNLVAAFNTAATTAGAPVDASLNASGAFELSTSEQGSAAGLSVTGGDGLATLGLSAGQSGTGTDAVVSVDGTSTTLSSLDPGGSVVLDAPGGSVTVLLASSPGAAGALVGTGSASANVVSTGNGSLASVVSAINGAGLGVTASAVEDSAGAYLLQVGADTTGLAGAVSVDPTDFSGGALGSLRTITSAQDALVSVGGSDGYEVSSSTSTFSSLLPGTAVTVAGIGATTVTVSADAAGEASKVSSLVSAANQALADIQTYAGYNESTKAGGPLMGSSVIENLQQQILSTFAVAAGTSGLGNSTSVGISLTSTGTIKFDQATFEKAYSADPSQVASLFTQGGTFAPASGVDPGAVSFVYAGTHSVPGSYAVQVSQSASQATDTGAVLAGGTTSAAEQLTVGQGSAQAIYTVAAGQSLTSIAAGLDAAFASSGLPLSASVVANGTQLQLTSDAYGSAQGFSVTSSAPGAGTTGLGGTSAGTNASFAGTDVAGTIDGVAATGDGQVLSAPSSDPTLQGLSLLVSAPGISSPTSLGSFAYVGGLAQQLAGLADSASNASTGSITTTIQGLQNESTGLDGEIANYQKLETNQQTLLQDEFAKMETTLGNLKNESSSLTSSIAQLPGF